ncbi:OadG family protein [Thermodesulfobacteriota bacterium]
MRRYMSVKTAVWLLILCGIFILADSSSSWASVKAEKESLKLEFSRTGSVITAKLIPRAKSSSVLIDFKVSGGDLADVKGVDFEKAARPTMDHKDFRSALFAASIQNISKGSTVKLSITSGFFSKSTQYWIFNENLADAWMNGEAEIIEHPKLVCEMVLTLKDGGKFDADGAADGRITVIGGPKDSFWGYALGTLFIRFFGIFLVLSVLMVGMIISGKIFQSMERKKEEAASMAIALQPEVEPEPEKEEGEVLVTENDVDPEKIAAISAALHAHFSAMQSTDAVYLFSPEVTSWTQQGRQRIMGVRYLAIDRIKS